MTEITHYLKLLFSIFILNKICLNLIQTLYYIAIINFINLYVTYTTMYLIYSIVHNYFKQYFILYHILYFPSFL